MIIYVYALHTQVQKRLCVQDPLEPLEFYPVPLANRRIHGKTCVVISEDPLETSSSIPDGLCLGDVIMEVDSTPVENLEVRAIVRVWTWVVWHVATA